MRRGQRKGGRGAACEGHAVPAPLVGNRPGPGNRHGQGGGCARVDGHGEGLDVEGRKDVERQDGGCAGDAPGGVAHHHIVGGCIGRLDFAQYKGGRRAAGDGCTALAPLVAQRFGPGGRDGKAGGSPGVEVRAGGLGGDGQGRTVDDERCNGAGDAALGVGDHHVVVARIGDTRGGQAERSLRSPGDGDAVFTPLVRQRSIAFSADAKHCKCASVYRHASRLEVDPRQDVSGGIKRKIKFDFVILVAPESIVIELNRRLKAVSRGRALNQRDGSPALDLF